MPINSVQLWVTGLLDGLPLPGPAGEAGSLTCYITPPDPGELTAPAAYLWPFSGSERRLASPRAGGPGVTAPGWKILDHRVELYLVWTGAGDDPAADTSFAAVIDAVMAALRPSPDEVVLTDPVTGVITSALLGIGEDMTWEYAVVHTLADEAYLRYDARLTLTVLEYFQS